MNFFERLYMQLLGGSSTEYKKKHTYKVRFSDRFRFRDKDTHDRTLVPFHVHGEVVMAHSRKDAIKRWKHADLKHRRRR